MTPALQAVAQMLASRMADSLAWGTVIFLFAAVLLRVTRQNARTRFAVWFSALLAIGLVPWLAGEWQPYKFIPASNASHAAIMLPGQWALYLTAIWMVIAAWYAVGITRAVWRLHVLRRNCVALDSSTLSPMLQETLSRHGAARGVVLCTSDDIRVPTALGLRKPAIVLPPWVMRELSTVEVNQVLLHELAHLRRADDWTNLLQQAIKALFFFHPAVWWIEKKIALEREMACDDLVIAETASPRTYAECLARLAERSFLERSLALAHAALGKIRHTSLRVAEILNGNVERTRSWKPAVSLVGAFAIACGVWGAKAPKLIAFQDSRTIRGTQSISGSDFARVDAGIAQPVPVTSAKFIPSRQNRKMLLNARPVARRASSKIKAGNEVHLTVAEPTVLPFTETVFFVIEGRDSSSSQLHVYQIQMFRLTILQQSTAPASTSHQKET